MKASELCFTAREAGLSKFGKIKYRTGKTWEYNVMKWVSNSNGEYWSCDCLGFVHTMVNGFNGDKTKLGGGAVMDKFVTNASEKTTLYEYCYDQSYDFNAIKKGEFIYMDGHVGLYVGDYEPFEDGRIFNVSECCYSSFGGGGMLTYVSPTGTRYNHKGGSTAGAWEQHAKFYRVDYDEESEIIIPTQVTPQDIMNLANDVFIGKYGVNPTREKVITNLYGYDAYRKVQDIMNIVYR